LICAVIEIVVEVISLGIYCVVISRIRSKHKLYKTMSSRDKARSDLYLAQLRLQSAPNTPGLKTSMANDFGRELHDPQDAAEKGVAGTDEEANEEAEWARRRNEAFDNNSQSSLQESQLPKPDNVQEHGPMSPGEKKYDSVPIPGAY